MNSARAATAGKPPRFGEFLCAIRRDEGPHAAAKACTECRRGISAELSRHAHESDRLRHLIAEQSLDAILRPRHLFADRLQVRARERVGRLRNDVVRFRDELVEPVE